MMVRYRFIDILTMLCIINTTTAFNCWICSSDDRDSEFCGKVLHESSLTRYQSIVNLVHCPNPPNHNQITKCMVRRTTNNGKTVYSRSCIFEDPNAEKNSCVTLPAPFGHQIEACETCTNDKCNYLLTSESHNRSTQLMASLFPIMLIFLMIVL